MQGLGIPVGKAFGGCLAIPENAEAFGQLARVRIVCDGVWHRGAPGDLDARWLGPRGSNVCGEGRFKTAVTQRRPQV